MEALKISGWVEVEGIAGCAVGANNIGVGPGGAVKVGKKADLDTSSSGFVMAVPGALPSKSGNALDAATCSVLSFCLGASKLNKGEVPKEKLGGAGEADGWSRTLFGCRGAVVSTELDGMFKGDCAGTDGLTVGDAAGG